VDEHAEGGKLIAIDGKTARRSHDDRNGLSSAASGQCLGEHPRPVDGRDIRFFIRVLFGVEDDEFRVFAADMNSDGLVDVNDVPLFVDTLLTVES